MKKATLVLLLAIISLTATAQAPFVQWQRSLGGTAIDAAMGIQRTTDSGYIVICLTSSNDGDVTGSHGLFEYWLVKLSSWGSIVWKRSLGGSNDDKPTAVQQTADGGYVLSGYSNSLDGDVTGNHGDYDIWVVKTNDTGGIQWQKSLGGSLGETSNAIQQTSDGGYIVTGHAKSTDGDVTVNHGNEDIWVVKLNASGGIVWQKTYGGSGEEDGNAILQTSDGGYIVAGNTKSTDGDVTGNHGGGDIWVIKLSATGAIEWEHCYGGSGSDQDGDHAYPGTIEQTTDGGYILAGLTNSTDGDVTGYHGGILFDFWVVKLSPLGSITWEKSLGGTIDDDGYMVQQTNDGGYIVSGTSNSLDGDVSGNYGSFDFWVVKLFPSGSIEWEKNYGGSNEEYAYRIRATSDSEFIVAGFGKSNDVDVSGAHGDYDGWIAKLAYCSLPTTSVIFGSTAVCGGSVIYLSDPTTGGIWSVSNGNATVAGGAVTGVYAGNVAVFYTITNTCGTGGATHIVHVSKPNPVIVTTGTILSTTTAYSSYQWIKNGTNISGATNATYTVTVNGIYSVTVTDAGACTGTSIADTVSSIGISTVNNNFGYAVIPNPTSGLIYIQGGQNVTISVYNMMGQLMKHADNANYISIANLPNGMYFIRLSDQQGQLIRQEKVIKE